MPVKSAAVDIDADGRPERLEIEVQGTARGEAPVVHRADGRATDLRYATRLVDDGDRLGISTTARWLLSGRRVYVLHYGGWGEGYLRFAWRLGPDGQAHAVCRFAPVTRVTLEPRTPGDAPVCRAVAAGRTATLPVRRRDPPSWSPAHDFIAARGQVTGDTAVDFDNSGRVRALQRIEGASSAGAGYQLHYFDLDPAAPQAGRAELLRMQSLDLSDAYPRRTCLDAEPSWLRYRGAIYLDTRSIAWAKPAGERAEYRWIDTIARGVPRRVCEARYVHMPPRLTGVWRGRWTAP